MIDSRAARVLTEGARDMVDADEWEWIAEHARGAYDHLIIASTLPVFMLEAIHDLEAWNEAVCAGAWGAAARGSARSSAARSTSSTGRPSSARSAACSSCCTSSPRGPDAPGTITFIGGDVHTAYIAEVTLGDAQQSRVFQVVCSPFRNPLRAARAAHDPPAADPRRAGPLPAARTRCRRRAARRRAGASSRR